ncbi:hypothetical protein C8R44DRAFT_749518 [Mycena epipterygia]|nr:hypothetical protein C8R44DRAFT_749518 [Mycena epipterygia]
MVNTFSLFVAALAVGSVSALPIYGRDSSIGRRQTTGIPPGFGEAGQEAAHEAQIESGDLPAIEASEAQVAAQEAADGDSFFRRGFSFRGNANQEAAHDAQVASGNEAAIDASEAQEFEGLESVNHTLEFLYLFADQRIRQGTRSVAVLYQFFTPYRCWCPQACVSSGTARCGKYWLWRRLTFSAPHHSPWRSAATGFYADATWVLNLATNLPTYP